MNFIQNISTELKSKFVWAYWLVILAYGYLSSTVIYFYIFKANGLSSFIINNELFVGLRAYPIVVGFLILFTILIGYFYVKKLKDNILYIVLSILLIIVGLNIDGFYPMGHFFNIVLFSSALAIFFIKSFAEDSIRYFQKHPWMISLIFVFFFFGYTAFSLLRHYRLYSHSFDLGIFVQAFYNLSHFGLQNTVREVPNIWGDHFHLIYFPLSFLVRIFPSASTLLVIQSLIFILGGIPLYLISKQILKSRAASIIIVACYFSFFGVSSALEFDFHEIVLAPTFFLSAFYFMMNKKWGYYFLSLILFLACKEDVGIFAFFLGIFMFFFDKKNWKFALITSILGVAWFGIATKIIMPSISGQDYSYFQYTELGKTPLEAIKGIIYNPLHAIHALVSVDVKRITLYIFFASFGFLGVFAPSFLFLALPMVGENLWNDGINRWFGFHYEIVAAPVFAIATIYGIYNITKIFNIKQRKNIMIFLATIAFLSATFVGLDYRQTVLRIFNPLYWKIDQETKDTYKAFDVIEKDASVAAQQSLVPHLAMREKIYHYPGCKLYNCDDVDYFIFSLAGSKQPFETKEDQINEISNFLNKEDFREKYGLYYFYNGSFVFKNHFKADPELVNSARDYLNNYVIVED